MQFTCGLLLVESKGLPIQPQNFHLQRTIFLPHGINICHEPSCQFPSNLAVTTRYLKDFMSLQAWWKMAAGTQTDFLPLRPFPYSLYCWHLLRKELCWVGWVTTFEHTNWYGRVFEKLLPTWDWYSIFFKLSYQNDPGIWVHGWFFAGTWQVP
jgi:hypothetical protein